MKYSWIVAAWYEDSAARVLNILTQLLPQLHHIKRQDGGYILVQQARSGSWNVVVFIPLELMDRMLTLTPPPVSHLPFCLPFVHMLPAQVHTLITQTEFKDLQQLAKAANKAFFLSAPRHGRMKQGDLCYSHTKFGEKATKCKQLWRASGSLHHWPRKTPGPAAIECPGGWQTLVTAPLCPQLELWM